MGEEEPHPPCFQYPVTLWALLDIQPVPVNSNIKKPTPQELTDLQVYMSQSCCSPVSP